MLHRRLGGEQQAEHVDVEHPVEFLLGDGFDRREFIDPGVVDQDVEPAIVLDGRVDDALRFRSLGDVTSDRNGFAAGRSDGIDNDFERPPCWMRN